MDASSSAAIATALGSFSEDAVTQYIAIIPIAATVLITVAVVFAAIKWFRAMAHA